MYSTITTDVCTPGTSDSVVKIERIHDTRRKVLNQTWGTCHLSESDFDDLFAPLHFKATKALRQAGCRKCAWLAHSHANRFQNRTQIDHFNQERIERNAAEKAVRELQENFNDYKEDLNHYEDKINKQQNLTIDTSMYFNFGISILMSLTTHAEDVQWEKFYDVRPTGSNGQFPSLYLSARLNQASYIFLAKHCHDIREKNNASSLVYFMYVPQIERHKALFDSHLRKGSLKRKFPYVQIGVNTSANQPPLTTTPLPPPAKKMCIESEKSPANRPESPTPATFWSLPKSATPPPTREVSCPRTDTPPATISRPASSGSGHRLSEGKERSISVGLDSPPALVISESLESAIDRPRFEENNDFTVSFSVAEPAESRKIRVETVPKKAPVRYVPDVDCDLCRMKFKSVRDCKSHKTSKAHMKNMQKAIQNGMKSADLLVKCIGREANDFRTLFQTGSCDICVHKCALEDQMRLHYLIKHPIEYGTRKLKSIEVEVEEGELEDETPPPSLREVSAVTSSERKMVLVPVMGHTV